MLPSAATASGAPETIPESVEPDFLRPAARRKAAAAAAIMIMIIMIKKRYLPLLRLCFLISLQ